MKPEDWQPIEAVPEPLKIGTDSLGSPKVLVWMKGGPHLAQWNNDRYNARRAPRPYWDAVGQSVAWSRANPPTLFQAIVPPDLPVINVEEGDFDPNGRLHVRRSYYLDLSRVFLALQRVGDTDVTQEEVSGWTAPQLQRATEWALSVHYAAGGSSGVKVPARPDFIPVPSQATIAVGEHQIIGADRPD